MRRARLVLLLVPVVLAFVSGCRGRQSIPAVTPPKPPTASAPAGTPSPAAPDDPAPAPAGTPSPAPSVDPAAVRHVLESRLQIDLDGDGRLDTLAVRFAPPDENGITSASLTITSGTGKELWQDEWDIVPNDMHQFLGEASGGVSSREDLAALFFCPGDHRIGADLGRVNVPLGKEGDDHGFSAQLEKGEQYLGVPAADLRKWIVSHNPNLVIRYRRTWPEDMLEIVYVPEVGQCVAVGWGPY